MRDRQGVVVVVVARRREATRDRLIYVREALGEVIFLYSSLDICCKDEDHISKATI